MGTRNKPPLAVQVLYLCQKGVRSKQEYKFDMKCIEKQVHEGLTFSMKI